MIRVYLAEQVIADGRVQYRRWSPDCDGIPPYGGAFQAQTDSAHEWMQEQLERYGSVPTWPIRLLNNGVDLPEPFEVIDVAS